MTLADEDTMEPKQVSSPDDPILNQCKWCNLVVKFAINETSPVTDPTFWVRCASGNVSADHEERGRGSRYWMGGTLTGFEGGFALHGQQRALCAAALHGQRAPNQALCAAADQTQWGKGWRQWGRTVSGHKSSLTRWVGAYSSVSAHPKYCSPKNDKYKNKIYPKTKISDGWSHILQSVLT